MQRFLNDFQKLKKWFVLVFLMLVGVLPFFSSIQFVNQPSKTTLNSGNAKKIQQAAATPTTFLPATTHFTVSNYRFPAPEFVNGNKLTTYNIHNLYNIANSEFSLLYAKKQTAVDSVTGTVTPDQLIDSLVYLNTNTNQVVWALEATNLITALTTDRSANHLSATVATKIIFNKVVFSARSQNFYLAIAAQTNNHDNDQGHTVIFQINQTTGATSVYFDSARVIVDMINTGNVNYKERPFNNIEIQNDGTTPTLIVSRTQFYKALTDESTIVNQTSATGINQGNKIQQGFLVMLIRAGRIMNNLSNARLSATDLSFINANANNKIVVTNSFILNGALVFITQQFSADNTLPTEAVAYSFSLNGNRINAPIETNLEFFANQQTFFKLWKY
ncbi:hypothetical protein J2Z62_000080 [Mycoplasmoides fastidiosum]|uniref:Uncharacterized protein n=1 Tax=Mycoplasmoides fastidiosum TaxID=92758 RepID=A0ABU0LY59_9BACT|nr:hypothetical protein [Mycoplasmoides fastidiosum]MDQ0513642.1 hypothetical protein [Mycoplasmoides fastidiosum]UUD37938.1 hypothetical protein NPA10_00885 [Mycoplasmoides fastidiosum]